MTNTPKIENGIYRLEFTRQDGENFMAEVAEGPLKGHRIGVRLDLDGHAVSNIDSYALRVHTDVFARIVAPGGEHSPAAEDYLFRAFIAEIREGRIVAISDGVHGFELLPLAVPECDLGWSEEAGWMFPEPKQASRAWEAGKVAA